ncbi:hypothetical protein Tco_0265836, partial [Tanacetum coccineum]
EDFVPPPSEEELLNFLLELGYKGHQNHLPNMENIEYPELIWEDLAYQIDYGQAKLRRREIKPYPRFTKIIINYFHSLNPSIPKGPSSGLHTIMDDRVISRFKFVIIGEDFQEYGLAILETMLTEEIKHSEAYQTFIKYSTCLIPPKKSRGKGSQGKKTAVTPKHASVEVSDESDPEPAKIRTCSRRLTGVFIQDTSNIPKKKSVDHSQKLKGSSEGASITPWADESTDTFKTSSEGTGIKPGVPDKVYDNVIEHLMAWSGTDLKMAKQLSFQLYVFM